MLKQQVFSQTKTATTAVALFFFFVYQRRSLLVCFGSSCFKHLHSFSNGLDGVKLGGEFDD
jgi:hypothetical protein